MPSAFILVLVDVEELDLVMPEGVVIVFDLLVVAEPLVIVLDLVMPAGLLIVLDFVVTLVAGVWAVRVVIFDELVLIVVVLADGVGAGVWAKAAEPLNKASETRKPRMRFIKDKVRVRVRNTLSTPCSTMQKVSNVAIFQLLALAWQCGQAEVKRHAVCSFQPASLHRLISINFTKESVFSLLAIMASFAVAPEASAQTTTPDLNAPRTNNRARIRQGVASGQLPRPKAARLRAHQADIHQDKKVARADGVVTHDEHQNIGKDERQANRAIYTQKHDAKHWPHKLR